MNWAWATSLDQIWRSPTFPMWLTLAAAGFFGILALITLLRAEKSVANGALTVITLLAIGIAVAATIREFGPQSRTAAVETRPPQVSAALPALSCLDDLAGDMVLAGCEKALFGSAESTAAAVSYAAAQLSRLTALGDVVIAAGGMTPELRTLRRAVEHDRYGLMAQVLVARDHCTPLDCAAFRSLTDKNQILANMDQRTYDGIVARYAPSWNAPTTVAAGTFAPLPPSIPTGRPVNIDFPTAASTPPVSIMNPEPGTSTPRAKESPPAANAPTPAARPTVASAPAAAPAAAAKKPAASKHPPTGLHPSAPVQLAPAPRPPEPAASND